MSEKEFLQKLQDNITRIYISPNIYLSNGKRKKSWYYKYKNTTKLIGHYPQISYKQALLHSPEHYGDITLNILLDKLIEIKRIKISQYTMKTHLILINKFKKESPLYLANIKEITIPKLLSYYNTLTYYNTLKLHTYIKQALDYAVACGYIDANPIANFKLSVVYTAPTVQHRAYSTDRKFIYELIDFINNRPTKTRLAYLVTLLLALRVGTTIKLRAEYFDFKKEILTIPADIMKMRIEHVMPLPIKLIPALQKHFEYDNFAMNPESLRVMLQRRFDSKTITTHGFRAMFSTIAHDHEQDPIAIEWYLAHYNANSVERAYNHSQSLSRKRKLLNFWYNELDNIKEINYDY